MRITFPIPLAIVLYNCVNVQTTDVNRHSLTNNTHFDSADLTATLEQRDILAERYLMDMEERKSKKKKTTWYIAANGTNVTNETSWAWRNDVTATSVIIAAAVALAGGQI